MSNEQETITSNIVTINKPEDIKLNENNINEELLKSYQLKRFLSKFAFWWAGVSMTIVLISIILFIITITYASYHYKQFPDLKDFWHFYLITMVSLTTLFGILATFNRSVWYDYKTPNDDKNYTIPQIKNCLEMFKDFKNLSKNE